MTNEDYELIEKIRSHYIECNTQLGKMDDMTDIKGFLDKNFIGFGICNCAAIKYDTHIYFKNWIDEYCPPDKDFGDGAYWTYPPYCLNTKGEVMKSIETRIGIMSKILNNR